MPFDLAQNAVYYALLVLSILIALTAHEYAHARTALAFGDTTARDAGRVSLNPLVHIDPVGILCMLFVGFGWARPTPTNPSLMRNPRMNDLVVSAAGPLSNFAVAIIAGLLLRFDPLLAALDTVGARAGGQILLAMLVQLNIALAVFNFLPLGSLDGTHVVKNLLPPAQGKAFEQFNFSYGSLILMGLLLMGSFGKVSIIGAIIGPPVNFFSRLILG